MYHQVKLFLLIRLQVVFKTYQHVFEMYWKDGYLQKDLPRLHIREIYGQDKNLPQVNSLKIPKLLEQFF